MKDDGSQRLLSNDPENSAITPMWFQRFLRTDSAWSSPACVLFVCASVFCTAQFVPHLVQPDFQWGWGPSVCFWIFGVCGAVTGFLVAQYRFAGLLAGALAGCGSLLTSVFFFEAVGQFSRIVEVLALLIGLLPGVAVYCVLHVVIDRLKARGA